MRNGKIIWASLLMTVLAYVQDDRGTAVMLAFAAGALAVSYLGGPPDRLDRDQPHPGLSR